MFYYFISSLIDFFLNYRSGDENEDENENEEEYFLWQIEDLLVEIDRQINSGIDLY